MKASQNICEFNNVFEKEIGFYVKNFDTDLKTLWDAMGYSLLSGGKRLRPYIMYEFYKMNGGIDNNFFNFAAALEMIHTYSLIHDDLPCMDNDSMRRGKPSCHAAFGEANALLAGDALLTLAFKVAADTKDIDNSYIIRAISVLSECSGANGMIGGQLIDLESENKEITLETVKKMYYKKTGELLKAAAVIGTVLAGGDSNASLAAEKFAENIGIAFQIRDDILDVSGNENDLGKPVGSDLKNRKSTYISIKGIENAEKDIILFTESAKSALSAYGEKNYNLILLADYLVGRNK